VKPAAPAAATLAPREEMSCRVRVVCHARAPGQTRSKWSRRVGVRPVGNPPANGCVATVYFAGRFSFREPSSRGARGLRWTGRPWRGRPMLVINERIRIPEEEFDWSFVRSGGPGGQNVNKVASKAVLRWDVANSPSLPDDVKARFRAQQHRRITGAG